MSTEEFREQLTRYGIDPTIVNNKIVVPCPRDHQNLPKNKRANVMIGMTTDFGECGFCNEKFNSEKLLTEYKELHEKEKPKLKIVSNNNKALKAWTIGEIMAEEFGEDTWLVEGLIPLPGIAALSGMPGDYKTWLTMHIALCVARGLPVFGQFITKQGSVLVIDEENHLKHIQKRLMALSAKTDDPIRYLSMSGFKADNQDKRDQVLKLLDENAIQLVIIDSLIRIHDRDENDASQMAKVFNGLQEITKRGASILFTHHHRKQADFRPSNPAQSLRGSSDILAALDSHISVERKKDEDIIVLRQPKSRQAEPNRPFEVRIMHDIEGRPSGFEYVGQHDEAKKKAEEASVAIENLFSDNSIKSTADIEQALSGLFGVSAIREGVKTAHDGKRIERVPKDELPDGCDTRGGKHYYRATKSSQDDFSTLPPLIG